MSMFIFFAFCIAIAFLVGALSVHAYPKFDWRIGDVHDSLQKRYRAAVAFGDRVKAWFVAKKSRV